MSSATPPPGEIDSLIWTPKVAGRARRWGRIVAFLAAIIVGGLGSSAIVGWFTGNSANPVSLLVMLCVPAAYLLIEVELQLTRLRTGFWRFHYCLRSILMLTAIAASLFGLVTFAFRENQRAFAINRELKKELDSVVQGGTILINMLDGRRRIACEVTRSSFSDNDLARVIGSTSLGGSRTCELEMLFMGGTKFTNAGICLLAGCEKLVTLELPPIDLSAAAIDSLAKCRRLELVVIDERRLNAERLNHLRDALPHIRLNGHTWAQRIAR